MATILKDAPPEVNPWDVSRAELYTQDIWQEPFRQMRADAPIYHCPDSKFGPYWSVTTSKPIQHIEALPKIFSSSWEYGGITVAGEAYSEEGITVDELVDHLWRLPKPRRKAVK